MKHLKRILLVILVLVVFVGSFIGCWHLFHQGTYEFDIKNLSVFFIMNLHRIDAGESYMFSYKFKSHEI